MSSDSEKKFLERYNSNRYEKLSVTSDVLIFSVADEPEENYRKLSKKYFAVLLVKRHTHPFKDMWCLPGGFINIDETTLDASKRILKSETNLENIYLEQLYTFDAVNRDPRMRIISTSYMALVDKNLLNTEINPNASWFNMIILEDDNFINVSLDNGIESFGFTVKKTLRELTTDRYEYTVVKNDRLAFDHPLVIASGISRLKNKLEYTDIVFNMMPTYFTLGELQQVYEVVLGEELLDPAFRRIISSKVEKTDKVKTGGGHRPSVLFKYKGSDKNGKISKKS